MAQKERKQSAVSVESAQKFLASALSTAAAAANVAAASTGKVDVLGVKLPSSVRIIPYEDLQLNKKLGAGSFGYVGFGCPEPSHRSTD